MPFVPTDPGSLPSPDEVLAQLQPEPGDPAQGYVTPADIEYAWQVFLSRLSHHDSSIAAQAAALTALDGRVTAVEGVNFTTVATQASLSGGDAGDLALALDTGNWLRFDGAAWNVLGLDSQAVPQAIADAVAAHVAAADPHTQYVEDGDTLTTGLTVNTIHGPLPLVPLWYGTEAQRAALGSYSNGVLYLTSD